MDDILMIDLNKQLDVWMDYKSSWSTCELWNIQVRNLNVRPDSSLWHNRDNSVLLGSSESKQGQGGKLGHGGMWKIPWIQLSSWGNNITWSSWGIKIRHPYDQYAERVNNTPPSMANMLNRVLHQHYLHEGTKSATPYDQYAERANNINFIFMRDQNSPPPQNNMLIGEINNINFIFMRDPN